MSTKIHVAVLLSVAVVLFQPSNSAFAADEFKLKSGKRSPETVTGATTVDAEKAKKLFDKEVIFVDVRKDKDWQAGRIPGAYHLELKKMFNKDSLSNLVNSNASVVFYCNGPKCLRSSKSSQKAVSWGFRKVYYFRGGLPAWRKAGYPVE